MNESLDNLLVPYLLGALSETETEQLDALSFTDPEFAGRLSAAENDLVDAYVQGELTGDTLDRFESHYLASPLRREKVDLARTFQSYAGQNLSKTTESVAVVKRTPKASLSEIFQSTFLRWSVAVAAVLVLLAGGWWASHRQNPVVASFVLKPSLRSHNEVPSLPIPTNSPEVRMQLELESDDYVNYRVALTDESSSRDLWQSAVLKPTGSGEGKRLDVVVPAKLLRSQIYSLVVSGLTPDGNAEIVTNYPFRAEMK
jgi:hypothetical protein